MTVAATPAVGTIRSQSCDPRDLPPRERDAMFALLRRHFDGVSREQFEADLAEKNVALLLHDSRTGALTGFSTMLAYEAQFEGRPLSVVCSGDTIVAPEAWRTPALPRAWIETVAGLRRRFPRGPLVWLLITSGFRTYRLLPVFWREFYPRFDARPTPPQWQKLTDALAAERFGSHYDASSGVVRFPRPQRLRDKLAGVPPGRETDPHVAFFAAHNPGHADGDELVCVAPLEPSNLTPAGRRMASAVPRW